MQDKTSWVFFFDLLIGQTDIVSFELILAFFSTVESIFLLFNGFPPSTISFLVPDFERF